MKKKCHERNCINNIHEKTNYIKLFIKTLVIKK